MSFDNSDAISQLHNVLSELESLARSMAGEAGDGGADLIEQLQGALAAARSRISDAEGSLRRKVEQGARAADGFVHEHTWMSIGIAAAVAFLLGTLTARRE